jgi:predicted membrane protein
MTGRRAFFIYFGTLESVLFFFVCVSVHMRELREEKSKEKKKRRRKKEKRKEKKRKKKKRTMMERDMHEQFWCEIKSRDSLCCHQKKELVQFCV